MEHKLVPQIASNSTYLRGSPVCLHFTWATLPGSSKFFVYIYAWPPYLRRTTLRSRAMPQISAATGNRVNMASEASSVRLKGGKPGRA